MERQGPLAAKEHKNKPKGFGKTKTKGKKQKGPGIIDQARNAETKEQKQKLRNKVKGYKFASPDTVRRVNKLTR